MGESDWALLETCADHITALTLQQRLEPEGVSTQLRTATPLLGEFQSTRVMVPAAELQRARRIIESQAVSEDELEFLATGGNRPPEP
jgi:hypothetical protein